VRRRCPGLPGGSGNGRLILALSGGHGTCDSPHASRVSWSKLLGALGLVGLNVTSKAKDSLLVKGR
jgi:hypothetical protein